MPSQLSAKWLIFSALAAATALASGCGDQGVKKVTVNGTVTYKGQPVRSGIVHFIGPEGAYTAAVLQSDGTFIMTDVVPGEVKVGVMESPQGTSDSSSGKDAPSRPTKEAASLPDKYRAAETSGLTYQITPDTTELKIELK